MVIQYAGFGQPAFAPFDPNRWSGSMLPGVPFDPTFTPGAMLSTTDGAGAPAPEGVPAPTAKKPDNTILLVGGVALVAVAALFLGGRR